MVATMESTTQADMRRLFDMQSKYSSDAYRGREPGQWWVRGSEVDQLGRTTVFIARAGGMPTVCGRPIYDTISFTEALKWMRVVEV